MIAKTFMHPAVIGSCQMRGDGGFALSEYQVTRAQGENGVP